MPFSVSRRTRQGRHTMSRYPKHTTPEERDAVDREVKARLDKVNADRQAREPKSSSRKTPDDGSSGYQIGRRH